MIMDDAKKTPWLAFFCIANFYVLSMSRPRDHSYDVCAGEHQ